MKPSNNDITLAVVHTSYARWSRKRKKKMMNRLIKLHVEIMLYNGAKNGRFYTFNRVWRYVAKRFRFSISQEPAI